MMKHMRYLVLFSLAFCMTPQQSHAGIFATDNRPNGVIAAGALITAAGLYIMCKESPEKRSKLANFAQAAAAGILVPTGVICMLASSTIVKGFDQAMGKGSMFDL